MPCGQHGEVEAPKVPEEHGVGSPGSSSVSIHPDTICLLPSQWITFNLFEGMCASMKVDFQ